MRVSGEEYSKRLASYSVSTLQLITDLNASTKEKALRKSEIIATTDTEEEVVKKLTALLEE